MAKLKLYGGNLIRARNAWGIGVVRYSAGILDCSDQKTEGNGWEDEEEVDNVWGILQEGECS